MKAAEDYIKTFSDLIKAQGYISQQVFNCDETGLFWKKMPNRTYITAEEKMMPRHKPMKDRLTLALCANAVATARSSLCSCTIRKTPEHLNHIKF
ncbi:hypothetical protein CDAR_228661 [Caerostris darwini]|uniref:Transposase n=1 Tax=Caerostris darwini TaxID=1538125 RepID=A0AAV4N5U9_9ARAC|nr:hypothetical protein CDAR_228661 [Caerostris darwini]